MVRNIKQVINKKGVTLIELIVAMLVMVTIMTAVSTVFMPMFQAYQRASNLAEVNSLLDNISSLIMNDVSSATEITIPDTPPVPGGGPVLTLLFGMRASFFIEYYIDGDGILWRGVQDEEPIRLLPLDYYKFWRTADTVTVFSVSECRLIHNAAAGTVTLELEIESLDGWSRDRTYTVRPLRLS